MAASRKRLSSKQVHDMLDDSDNDDDVDLDLSCDSSDNSDSDNASERDVEPDTGDDSDPDDVTWLAVNYACQRSQVREKFSYQLLTLNRWITLLFT